MWFDDFRDFTSEIAIDVNLLPPGAWLAMVITFTCSLGLTFFVVRQTRKSWDYVVSASVVHFVICCIGKVWGGGMQHRQ
jgi:hypothetical protein